MLSVLPVYDATVHPTPAPERQPGVVPEEVAGLPDLEVLGADAQRVVETARDEAGALGHPRVGTEHLLLGIMADEGSDATQALAEAGAGRAAVWAKVREARPPVAGGTEPSATQGTPRAARAIGRSVRFSRRHDGPVTAEDLLIGVLDVEGTAGQVLRSLGVDLDDVLSIIDGGDTTTSDAVADEGTDARCPSCEAALTSLAHRRLVSAGVDGSVEVLVHTCPECGTVLGLSPAET